MCSTIPEFIEVEDIVGLKMDTILKGKHKICDRGWHPCRWQALNWNQRCANFVQYFEFYMSIIYLYFFGSNSCGFRDYSLCASMRLEWSTENIESYYIELANKKREANPVSIQRNH